MMHTLLYMPSKTSTALMHRAGYGSVEGEAPVAEVFTLSKHPEWFWYHRSTALNGGRPDYLSWTKLSVSPVGAPQLIAMLEFCSSGCRRIIVHQSTSKVRKSGVNPGPQHAHCPTSSTLSLATVSCSPGMDTCLWILETYHLSGGQSPHG